MALARRSLTSAFSRLHLAASHAASAAYAGDDRRQPPPRSAHNFTSPLHRHLLPHRFYSASAAGSEIIPDDVITGSAAAVGDVITDSGFGAVAAAVPSEVAVAAADSYLPVAALQYVIDGVHNFTGLGWWASIVLTTFLIRSATLPLLISQMKSSVKLAKMRPELEELKAKIDNSMDPESIARGQQKMKALFVKHGVTPFTPLKGMFIQAPIFISFFLAISNMAEKVPSFKEGGAFWFLDLTTPDPLYAFPVLTSLTFLATVELNMQEGMEGNSMANTMKKVSRVFGVLTIPLTSQFPKAIFCYWITSNIFSLTYGYVIRRPPVRKFLNLPDIVAVASANPAPQSNFNIFGGSKLTLAPFLSKEPEQVKSVGPEVSTPAPSSSDISQRIKDLEKKVKIRAKIKPKKH